MKKTILIAACVFSMYAIAGEGDKTINPHEGHYCAHMKDGKLVVMHQGNAITKEVVLANGTKIMMDGTVVKKDGSKVMLKEGECANKDGMVMMEEKHKEKEHAHK